MADRVLREWPTMLAGPAGGVTLVGVAASTYSLGVTSPYLNVPPLVPPTFTDPANTRFLIIAIASAVLSLALLRWWPFLLVAGTLAVLPYALIAANRDPMAILAPTLAGTYLGIAGTPMVLIATLAAAQRLVAAGRVGPGAAVAAGTVGAQVLAGLLFADGLRVDLLSWFDEARLALTVFGLAGAVPVLVMSLRHQPVDGDRPDASWRTIARPAAIGAVATCVGFLSLLLPQHRLVDLFDLLGVSSGPTRPVTTAALGAVIALAGAALAALLGWRVLLSVATAAPAMSAVPAVWTLVVQTLQYDTRLGRTAALVATAGGVVVAASRFRTVLAVAAAVTSAVLLTYVVLASGGRPENWPLERNVTLAAATLVAVGVTVIATVGTAAIAAARRAALPAAFGPVLGAVVWGSGYLIAVTLRSPELDSNAWRRAHSIDVSAALLMLAAVLMAGAWLLGRLHSMRSTIPRAEHGNGPGPVEQTPGPALA
jgi:hypothetical protein